jgi:hypothetical protein
MLQVKRNKLTVTTRSKNDAKKRNNEKKDKVKEKRKEFHIGKVQCKAFKISSWSAHVQM